MSDYSALAEVASSLKRLIWNNISNTTMGGEVGSNGIFFTHPNNVTSVTALSIYLYRVEEDSQQRNQAWSFELNSAGNNATFARQPISLNLFYMITPNYSKTIKDKVLKDHLLMGRIIQIFHDNPVLKSPILQGPLLNDKLNLRFVSPSIDEINKIWSIPYTNQYMVSAFYEVSPLIINSERSTSVRKVNTLGGKLEYKEG